MRETFAVAASVGAHALRARVYLVNGLDSVAGVSGGNSVFCSRLGLRILRITRNIYKLLFISMLQDCKIRLADSCGKLTDYFLRYKPLLVKALYDILRICGKLLQLLRAWARTRYARAYHMGGVSGGNSVFCSRWGCGYCGLHEISTSFYLSACYKIAK